MEKFVIRQTKTNIGIIQASKFNKYVYENELKIFRYLLCECSSMFLNRLKEAKKDEIIQCLCAELEQDILTLYNN